MYQEDEEEINQCAMLGCREKATTFTAVYTFMDEQRKRKTNQREALGSPMVVCKEHAEGRKEYFEAQGRRIKIIEDFQK